MAIEYSLLLKSQKLSKEILIGKIESLGYSCNKIETLTKGICINLNKEIGFSIFLVRTNNYPYNSWESNFTESKFTFEKILIFRFAKEYSEFEKRYDTMLKILFELAIEINEEAIFISNGDTELCFFRGNKDILLNNETGIWDSNCFRDILKSFDVYVEYWKKMGL